MRAMFDLTPGRADHPPAGGDQTLIAPVVDCLPLVAQVPPAAIGLDDDLLVAPDEIDADGRAAIRQNDELVGLRVGDPEVETTTSRVVFSARIGHDPDASEENVMGVTRVRSNSTRVASLNKRCRSVNT